jgi:hypothetical protein
MELHFSERYASVPARPAEIRLNVLIARMNGIHANRGVEKMDCHVAPPSRRSSQ